MTHVKIVEEGNATGLLSKIYSAAVQRVGYVANIIKMMSLHPPSCQASMQFYASFMKSENALDPATREMLATVVSNINDCHY